MLVLSRKSREQIVIGDGPGAIILTVVDIRGDRVRIGIEAPDNVPVYKGEVRDRMLLQAGAPLVKPRSA